MACRHWYGKHSNLYEKIHEKKPPCSIQQTSDRSSQCRGDNKWDR